MVAAVTVAAPHRVDVRDGYVEPTAAGGSVAVRGLMFNPSPDDVTLTGAESPLAGQTVIQRYERDARGLVQMRVLESLVLPRKSETVLAPGVLELQLIGVTQELKDGVELPLTLTFGDGTKRTYRIDVKGD